jgi:hypothetical protein
MRGSSLFHDCETAVRRWTAVDGVSAVAHERSRLRSENHCDPRGQGGEGSCGDAASAVGAALRAQLAYAHSLWTLDRAQAAAHVEMPEAVARKYPRAGASWPWFRFFPAAAPASDPRTNTHVLASSAAGTPSPLESLPDVTSVREPAPQYGRRRSIAAAAGRLGYGSLRPPMNR